MSKPAAPKAGSAQILAICQENNELLKNLEERMNQFDKKLNDQIKISQEVEIKLDNVRTSATTKASGRARSTATGTKGAADDKKKPTPLAINFFFRDQWKKNTDETIERYCDADKLAVVTEAFDKDPRNAKKKDDVRKSALATAYYGKHLAKPNSPDFDRDAKERLKADHEDYKKSFEAQSDENDGDNTDAGATEGTDDLE